MRLSGWRWVKFSMNAFCCFSLALTGGLNELQIAFVCREIVKVR